MWKYHAHKQLGPGPCRDCLIDQMLKMWLYNLSFFFFF